MASTPPSLSTPDRDRAFDELESREYDVLVIGGGISGAGAAWELSRRGMLVALVEGDDYAAGTSSRSSKLIHGGFRYLAQGHFRLVRTTARERTRVFALAPHLAERRWMVILTGSRVFRSVLSGMVSLYERLGRVTGEDVHRLWGAHELAEHEPAVATSRFPWACVHREFLTDDARLVLGNLRGAVAHGATAVHHARVVGLDSDAQGRVVAARVRCTTTGRESRVRARAIVNAAGPWVEGLQRMENARARRILALSKGIHVVLPAEKLPIQNLVVYQGGDGRRCFAVRRGGVVYLGTTETPFSEAATVWPSITQDDVDYLLHPLARYFDSRVQPGDIIGAWAGLRPLVMDPARLVGQNLKKRLGEISRRDEVSIGPGGMVSVAGGKLTGYASMAAKIASMVGRSMGQTIPVAPADTPLPGGDFDGDLDALAARLATISGCDLQAARRLSQLFGTEAERVVQMGAERLSPAHELVAGEVDWAVAYEGATSVEDVVYRRSRVAIYERGARDLVAPIAERMARLLSWTPTQLAEQLRSTRARLASDLDFKPAPALAAAPGMLTART